MDLTVWYGHLEIVYGVLIRHQTFCRQSTMLATPWHSPHMYLMKLFKQWGPCPGHCHSSCDVRAC